MVFPEYDAADFRRYLVRLFTSPAAGVDADQAGTFLGVSASTIRRWVVGSQRPPLATWYLVQLLASGEVPALYGWHGWRFIVRWEDAQRRYVHHLVCPEGGEYSPGQIRAWHFQTQELHEYRRQARQRIQEPVATRIENDRIKAIRAALQEALVAVDGEMEERPQRRPVMGSGFHYQEISSIANSGR